MTIFEISFEALTHLPDALNSRYYRSVGDVNGDGIEDVFAFVENTGQVARFKRNDAAIVFGTANGEFSGLDLLNLAADEGLSYRFDGNTSSSAPAPIFAGDFNGDGITDFISGRNNTLEFYDDFSGVSDGVLGATESFGQVHSTLTNGNDFFRFDQMIDFNGDGVLDVVAYRSDAMTIVFGQTGIGPGNFDISTAPTSQVIDITRGTAGGAFDLAGVGDYNSDGFLDYHVQWTEGSYYNYQRFSGILAGSAGGLDADIDLTALPSSEFFIGDRSTDFTSLGDINGDGLEDYMTHDGQLNQYLVMGRTTGMIEALLNPSTASDTSDYSGLDSRLISIGDFDGDGLGDMLSFDLYQLNSEATVIFGKSGAFPAAFDATTLSDFDTIKITLSNIILGSTPEALGDVNGDGFADFSLEGRIVYGFSRATISSLTGDEMDNTLVGGAERDYILAGAGNDVISGLAGNDFINGESGNDTLIGGDGDDSLVDTDGTDQLRGDSGNDVLRAEGGDDVLLGGDGNDTLVYSGRGNANLNGGDGDDSLTVDGSGTNLSMIGGAGNDTFNIEHAAALTGDQIVAFGGDGDDVFNVTFGFNADPSNIQISGGAGADRIVMTQRYRTENDAILVDAGAGDDYIEGSGTLRGNIGNDTLLGDRFSILEGGDGDDILPFFGAVVDGGAGTESIVVTNDVDTYNGRFFNTRAFDIGTSTVGEFSLNLHFYANNGILVGQSQVSNFESFEFEDFSINTLDFLSLTQYEGSNGADIYVGSTAAEWILGGMGSDSLRGGGGDDYIFGNSGNDLLRGGDGNDVISGGLSNGAEQFSRLYGNDGDDILLYGNEAYGGTGDDIIYEAVNAYGEDGNDIIRYSDFGFGGAGNDTFSQTSNVTGGAGNDSIDGASRINYDVTAISDLVITGDANTRTIDATMSGEGVDSLTNGQYTAINIAGSSVHYFAFRPALQINSGLHIILTENVDTILPGQVVGFSNGARRLYGQGGDDYLAGSQKGDLLDGGNDNDIIYGRDGDDELYGGRGDDKLYGDNGFDLLNGGDGNDILIGGFGFDTLNGGAGDDILRGSQGEDVLNGGSGNDILFIDPFDTVTGGAGYDFVLISSGGTYDLILTDIEKVQGNGFDNVLDGSAMISELKLFGQGGNDTLSGGSDDDQLFGGAGNDILVGNAGNDRLSGSLGADQFNGGDGNDTLLIDDADTSVVGGAGYDRVYVSGYSDGVTLDLTAGAIEYASGSAQDDTFTALGSSSAVKLLGRAGNDTLAGGDANDLIYGGNGNDTLTGHDGNDFLSGGAGNDTFMFAEGWGDDRIADFESGIDKVDFSGLSMQITFADLIITAAGSANTLVSYDGNSILLTGIALEDIQTSDFIF